jgi:cytochrome c-type biogenesis protein CcmF
MEPSRRIYPARNFPTTEAAFHTIGFSQLYISPGDPTQDGGIVVRFYHKPLVTLIWIGTLIMAAGGVLSLMDRRLRVGAPHTSQKAKRAACRRAWSRPNDPVGSGCADRPCHGAARHGRAAR